MDCRDRAAHPHKQFVLDGEAVLLVDGTSDFNAPQHLLAALTRLAEAGESLLVPFNSFAEYAPIRMKYATARPYAEPDKAARRILEIAGIWHRWLVGREQHTQHECDHRRCGNDFQDDRRTRSLHGGSPRIAPARVCRAAGLPQRGA